MIEILEYVALTACLSYVIKFQVREVGCDIQQVQTKPKTIELFLIPLFFVLPIYVSRYFAVVGGFWSIRSP